MSQALDEPDAGAIECDADGGEACPDGGIDPGPPVYTPPTPPVWDTTLAPGGEHLILEGTHEVTDDGAFTYSLPLRVPAGRNGVQPTIALDYDSRAGDGPVGVGWKLSGISSIQRCPRTADRGSTAPVMFTDEDLLCLDGKYLHPVATSAGGEGTIEYRAIPDGEERVVQYGMGNERTFVVTRRDGTRLFYGRGDAVSRGRVVRGAPGRAAAFETHTLAWWVDELEDTSGNTMRFAYEPGYVGDFGYTILRAIEWGANRNGRAHLWRLAIEYTARADVDSQRYFVSGMGRTTPFVMSKLDFGGFRYELAYSPSPTTARYRMREVKLCAATGTCSRPLAFTWEDGSWGVTNHTLADHYTSYLKDGDEINPARHVQTTFLALRSFPDSVGSQVYLTHDDPPEPNVPVDFIYRRFRGFHVDPVTEPVWNEVTPPFPIEAYKEENLPLRRLRAQAHTVFNRGWRDHDSLIRGAGYDEYAGFQEQVFAGGDPRFVGRVGRFMVPCPDLYRVDVNLQSLLSGDLNGDGQTDIVYACDYGQSGASRTYLRLGDLRVPSDGFGPAREIRSPSGLGFWYNPRLIDVDGDGSAEIIEQGSPYGSDAYMYSITDGGVIYSRSGNSANEFVYSATGRTSHVDGFPRLSPETFQNVQHEIGPRLEVDVNDDGLVDKVLFIRGNAPATSSYLPWIQLNTGNGFTAPYFGLSNPGSVIDTYDTLRAQDIRIADLNGDGRQDFVTYVMAADPRAPEASFPLITLHISTGRNFQVQVLGYDQYMWNQDPRHSWARVSTAHFNIVDLDGDTWPEITRNVWGTSSDTLEVSRFTGRAPDVIRSVDVGAREVRLEYADVGSQSVRDTLHANEVPACQDYFPLKCVRSGITVVRSVVEVGAATSRDFYYRNARTNAVGGAFLGFGQTVEVVRVRTSSGSVARGNEIVTEFDNVTRVVGGPGPSYPYARKPRVRTVRTLPELGTSRLIERQTTTWRIGARNPAYVPFAVEVAETVVDVGTVGSYPANDVTVSSKTTFEYDEFGTLKRTVATNLQSGEVREQTLTLSNNIPKWTIGLVTLQVSRHTYNGQTGERHFAREYDTRGQVIAEVANANDPSRRARVQFARDGFGNVYSMWRGGSSWQVFYDGRTATQPEVVRGPVGDWSVFAYEPVFGRLVGTFTHTGESTQTKYDHLGNVVAVQRGRARVDVEYARDAAGGLTTTYRGNDGSVKQTVDDALGRRIAERMRLLDGTWSSVERTYDGNRVMETAPHRTTDPASEQTQYFFDALGRSTGFERNGVVHSLLRRGLAIDAVVGSRFVSRTTLDSEGRTVLSETSGGAAGTRTLTYRYAPFDLLVEARAQDGVTFTYEYDAHGRLIREVNPNRGATSYELDAYGKVLARTDSRGHRTTFQYDALDRLILKSHPTDGVSSFEYGGLDLHGQPTSPLQLTRTLGVSGVETTYAYDTSGQQTHVRTRVNGTFYDFEVTRDEVDRVATMSYPAVGSEPALTVAYGYGAHGHLTSVRDTQTGKAYWAARRVGADGLVTESESGPLVRSVERRASDGAIMRMGAKLRNDLGGTAINDFSLFRLGAGPYGPFRRTDFATNRIEDYGYDDFGRLTSWNVRDGVSRQYTYSGPSGSLTSSDYGPVVVGQDTDGRAHAARSVAGLRMGYDARGRRFSSSNPTTGVGTTTLYNDFDLPVMTKAYPGQIILASFEYTADGARVGESRASERRVTLHGLYDGRTTTAGARSSVRRIVVEGQEVARVEWDSATAQTRATYPSLDQLGTVVAVVAENGSVLERSYSSPWGAPTDRNGATIMHNVADPRIERFEGHPFITPGVVDMRGRAYDPMTAQFLSPDPVVSNPLNAQAFNAYAFVDNRPTAATDPTGFAPCDAYSSSCAPNPVEAIGAFVATFFGHLFSRPRRDDDGRPSGGSSGNTSSGGFGRSHTPPTPGSQIPRDRGPHAHATPATANVTAGHEGRAGQHAHDVGAVAGTGPNGQEFMGPGEGSASLAPEDFQPVYMVPAWDLSDRGPNNGAASIHSNTLDRSSGNNASVTYGTAYAAGRRYGSIRVSVSIHWNHGEGSTPWRNPPRTVRVILDGLGYMDVTVERGATFGSPAEQSFAFNVPNSQGLHALRFSIEGRPPEDSESALQISFTVSGDVRQPEQSRPGAAPPRPRRR